MLVRFGIRYPGNHREIGQKEMDMIPRIGETVVLKEGNLEVHSVIWDMTKESVVTIWLNPPPR